MKKPFFSVVIPTYNRAELLRKALNSVLAQTFQDFEVLVIDNESSDNTRQVIESLNDGRIQTLKIRNQGVIAASRNLGIKTAGGEWVAFLDSDDTWHPLKLETVQRAIHRNPSVIGFCHNVRTMTDGVPGKIIKYGPACDNMYERLLFRGNALTPSASVIQREALIATGGFSEERDFVTVEDYEYWIRLAQYGKFDFLEDVLADLNFHGGNTSSSNIERHVNALIAVVSYHLSSLQNSESYQRKIRRRRGAVWCTGGRLLLMSGMFPQAVRHCLRGLSYSPIQWKGWIVLVLALLRIRI